MGVIFVNVFFTRSFRMQDVKMLNRTDKVCSISKEDGTPAYLAILANDKERRKITNNLKDFELTRVTAEQYQEQSPESRVNILFFSQKSI